MDNITEQDMLSLPPDETVVYHNSEAERWNYLISSMILNDGFIHEFLMLMSKYPDERIKTMGVQVVANMIKLCYAPTFLAKLTDPEARWVLCHEVMHVVFHHCTFRQSSDPRVAKLQNIAADMAINQLLPDNSGTIKKPRKEVIVPIMPEFYSFPPKLSMEQYFQLLLKKYDPNKLPPPPSSEEGDPQEGEGEGNGDGGEEDKDEEGSSSSSGEGDEDGKSSGGSGSDEDDPFKGKGDLVDNHDAWSDEDAGLIDSIIRDTIEQFNKSGLKWGSVSGDLKEMIMAAQRSQIKWWRVLREYIGHMISTIKTTTLKRPSKRYGYPFPGTKRKHVDKILVCGDSSGSVSDRAWTHFISELNTLAETHPVDWVIFDHGIQLGPVPFTRRVRKMDIPGRGGTSFKEPFELASKGGYKSLVILTDGAADPIPYPVGVKDVIWCLVGEGNPPVDWGKIVRIKEDFSMSLSE